MHTRHITSLHPPLTLLPPHSPLTRTLNICIQMPDWDDDKRQTNLARHGVDFAVAEGFDWSSARTEPDLRRDYGEERFESVGLIGERLHVLVFTPRATGRRIISLRKANPREIERWLT